MFRLIVFVTLIIVSNCFRWNSQDYEDNYDNEDHNHDVEDEEPDWELHLVKPWAGLDNSNGWHLPHHQRFLELSSYVIKADQYAQQFCKGFSNSDIKEFRGNTEYKIVYTIQKCDPEHVTVEIQHRVLYMHARKSNADNSGDYFDLRILPDMLKAVDATWKCEEDKLIVLIPYNMNVKSKSLQEKTCLDVNKDILTVPKAPNFQYKYGK